MVITNITKITDGEGNPVIQAQSTETIINNVVYDLPTIHQGIDKAMSDMKFWQSLFVVANGKDTSAPISTLDGIAVVPTQPIP